MRPSVGRILTVGLALAGGGLWAVLSAGGCQMVGGMAASFYKTGSHAVEADYPDLAGKKTAVIVAADRFVQADHPSLTPRLTAGIAARIAAYAECETVLNPRNVLLFQTDHPRWPVMSHSELAAALGVDRLVYVDVYDFRLHETGNQYLWDGRVAAVVGVVEADGALPDEFAYQKDIIVGFPDGPGYGPTDFTDAQVMAVLQSRFVDRVSWLFYEHEEKNIMDY